jgi:lipoyl(octanoyl) transferase
MNQILNKATRFLDLGLIDYSNAWDYQTKLFNETLLVKTDNRDLAADEQKPTPNVVIFCEHPHVFTLGKSGDEKNLLLRKDELHKVSATFHHINRGGDITYHGPGQIIGYPVIDLENFFTDIHRYMRAMEEAVIQTLSDLSVRATRIPGLTGVWIQTDGSVARKICAFGVKTSRWVTMHGFAFNVNTDLNYFNYIVPCGIEDKEVTSLEKELGFRQDIESVKKILKRKIQEQFQMDWL